MKWFWLEKDVQKGADRYGVSVEEYNRQINRQCRYMGWLLLLLVICLFYWVSSFETPSEKWLREHHDELRNQEQRQKYEKAVHGVAAAQVDVWKDTE